MSHWLREPLEIYWSYCRYMLRRLLRHAIGHEGDIQARAAAILMAGGHGLRLSIRQAILIQLIRYYMAITHRLFIRHTPTLLSHDYLFTPPPDTLIRQYRQPHVIAMATRRYMLRYDGHWLHYADDIAGHWLGYGYIRWAGDAIMATYVIVGDELLRWART